MNKLHFLLFFLITISTNIICQMAPGDWRDHLPYVRTEKAVLANDRLYCCTANSLFYYDITDKSINKISKVQGLTESEIVTIAFSKKYNVLIIAYKNSNIDVLQNGRIINLPYLKNKISISDKRITEIIVNEDVAYISCSFGIAVFDLKKLEISDTFYPSFDGSYNRVIDISLSNEDIYANTDQGIFKGKIGDRFLADYSRWEKFASVPDTLKLSNTEYVNNRIFATYTNKEETAIRNMLYFENGIWQFFTLPENPVVLGLNKSAGTIYINCLYQTLFINNDLSVKDLTATYMPTWVEDDGNGTQWIADRGFTLKKHTATTDELIKINSPEFPDAVQICFSNGVLWSVAGSKNDLWLEQFNNIGAQQFSNNNWTLVKTGEDILKNVRDFVNVEIDPRDPNHAFFASWYNGGLVEYNSGEITLYKKNNSTIMPHLRYDSTEGYRVYGLDFDANYNLWLTVSGVQKQLCVYTAEKKWYSFNLGENAIATKTVGDIVATSWGHKWITFANSSSIIVYDDNNTISNSSDDTHTSLSVAGVDALTPPTKILCITEDRDGSIWVGTDAGPVYFSNAQYAFNNDGIEGSKVQVRVEAGSNKAAYVLETEMINSIAIDGGNRKWLGTQSSGAYLLSADGTKEIAHFTAENSPLLSNTINDITIDMVSGEVFFATDKGIISYKGNSTQGGDEFGDVYVYPNPVRENFTGDIIIANLLQDADIRITDVAGNLVYKTTAYGGQAVWTGKNLLGKRVSTGIYYVFCSNKDGSKTKIAKVLFIN